MFQEFRPFFQFVLHCHTIIFSVPLALRLPSRPLFLTLLNLVLFALLKPYPTLADTSAYMALIPLFLPQLCLLQGGVLVAWLLVLVSVLGPAMYQQWIWTGSGNANFFYAATLVWGGVQVVAMLLMLSVTLQYDRLLAGKPVVYVVGRAAPPR